MRGFVLPDCAICLDETDKSTIVTTVCGHCYHESCIRRHDEACTRKRRKTTCPVCKSNLDGKHGRFIRLHSLTQKQIRSSSPPIGEDLDGDLRTPDELRLALEGEGKGKGKARQVEVEEDEGASETEEDPIDGSDVEDEPGAARRAVDTAQRAADTAQRAVDSALNAAAARITDLEGQLVALTANRDDLRAECVVLREFNTTELERLRGVVSTQEGHVRTANNKAQAQERVATRAKRTAEEAQKAMAEMEEEKVRWRREKVGLRDELAVVRDERDGLQTLLAKHEASVQEAQEIAADEATKAESLRTALEKAEDDIRLRDARIERYRRDKIEASQEELQKLHNTNSIQRHTIENLRAQLSGKATTSTSTSTAAPTPGPSRERLSLPSYATSTTLKSMRSKARNGHAEVFEVPDDDEADEADWDLPPMPPAFRLTNRGPKSDGPFDPLDDRDFVMPGVFADPDLSSSSKRPTKRALEREEKEDRVMKSLQAGGKALAIGEKKRFKVSKKR